MFIFFIKVLQLKKVLQLIKAEGIMKVENYYFATPYKIMDPGTNH